MKSAWRKFWSMLVCYYAEMAEYRAEVVFWAVSGVMPFFLMGLWSQASAQTGFGMQPVEFVRYFLAVFVCRQMTLVWVIYAVEGDVVSGELSPFLLQPLNPFWRYFIRHLSERLVRLPILAGLVGLFFLAYPQAFWVPSARAMAAASLALVLAFLLRFIMQYAFAMIAFWGERANAIEDLWFLLYLFLSGYIAPLEVFPEAVRKFALLTPFPYTIYLPATLITGGEADLGRGVLVILVWGAVFLGLTALLWRRGLRRYSAMGA